MAETEGPLAPNETDRGLIDSSHLLLGHQLPRPRLWGARPRGKRLWRGPELVGGLYLPEAERPPQDPCPSGPALSGGESTGRRDEQSFFRMLPPKPARTLRRHQRPSHPFHPCSPPGPLPLLLSLTLKGILNSVVGQLLSLVQLFAIPGTAACQVPLASLSRGVSLNSCPLSRGDC